LSNRIGVLDTARQFPETEDIRDVHGSISCDTSTYIWHSCGIQYNVIILRSVSYTVVCHLLRYSLEEKYLRHVGYIYWVLM